MIGYPLKIIKLIIIFEGLDLIFFRYKKKVKVMKWERLQHAANYLQVQELEIKLIILL